jgi:hypothetical protein
MSHIALSDARERFSAIVRALAGSDETGAIRFGFAELHADETAPQLIARADRELLESRHG